MNIFFTDKSPRLAAEGLCDQHVVKMILESGQMLCTAHRVLDGEEWINQESGRKRKEYTLEGVNDGREKILYKATHINHPMNLWIRECTDNYNWLYDHFQFLSQEYSHRFNKIHSTYVKIGETIKRPPDFLGSSGFAINESASLPPLCMPDEYKTSGVCQSYRNYMMGEKLSFGKTRITKAKWTLRTPPIWYFSTSKYKMTTKKNSGGYNTHTLTEISP